MTPKTKVNLRDTVTHVTLRPGRNKGCRAFAGFPIRWYFAPAIINTFLEAYDFSGKKIVLFAICGGSGFGKAVESLQPSAPKAEILIC